MPSTCETLVEVVCAGSLSPDDRVEFTGWEVTSRDGRTWLTSRWIDEAALHGALDRLHLLGLPLIEVRRYPQIRL